MIAIAKSVRSFIGAKNFEESRLFYRELGFEEIEIDKNMCFYKVDEKLGFYLQNSYVKDWIDNSMLFLEVDAIENWLNLIKSKNLEQKFKTVKLTNIKSFNWGREFYLHDPSGVLWHFGQFN